MSGKLTVLNDGPQPSTAKNSPVNAAEFSGNVALVTLGCAKNLVDSEIMLGALTAKGFRPVQDPQNAELIVVNTCAFLKSAVQEGIDKILEMAELKKTGRCRQLVVAGCMVERYRGELEQSIPEVDRFVSTDELTEVAALTETTNQCLDNARRPYFLYDETMPRVRSTGGHTTYVKVAEGCDRPCAFCIIPKIRGSFRSRPMSSIVSEVTQLISAGVREINFVAQDLTAYGTDLPGRGAHKPLLKELLDEIGTATMGAAKFWLRMLYAYPVGVTEELIHTLRDRPYICNYLDMPLQHISHPVLKTMRRPLGERGTRGLIEKIRVLAPEIHLRTTFIAGFPGETEADVESLANFIREGHFSHVGVFPYSQEEEAVSYNFESQVPIEERERRVRYLMDAQKELVTKRLQALIGTRVPVLVEGEHEESDLLLSARAEWQAPETDGTVIINDAAENLLSAEGDLPYDEVRGYFGEVEVTEVTDYDLIGTLVSVESK